MTELADFEKDMISMLKKYIKFRKINKHFQRKFQADIKFIKLSDKVFLKGDKSRNPHQLIRAEDFKNKKLTK